MSKLKSISLSASVYARLKEYAREHGVSMASVVEQAVAKDLGPAPREPRRARRYRGKTA